MLKPKVVSFGDNAYPFDQEPSVMDVTESFINNNSLSLSAPVTASEPSLYLVKALPPTAQITGSTNLLAKFGLESTFNKFSGKKLKESLSSFLPDVPGVSDAPGAPDGSSLRSLIEKPPIIGSKEIQPLSSGVLMAAFRLHPGPLPDQLRPQYLQHDRKRHKHHKNKTRLDPLVHDSRVPDLEEGKRHKKRKHEDGEKKKKKKDKKRKKEREKDRF